MCVISSTACRVKGDQVHQQESHVISFEGETVILPCVYESSSTNPNLFWYKQRPKDFPKFILRRDKFGSGDNGTEFNERFLSRLAHTVRIEIPYEMLLACSLTVIGYVFWQNTECLGSSLHTFHVISSSEKGWRCRSKHSPELDMISM